MLRAQPVLGARQQGLDDPLGDVGQVPAGGIAVEQAKKDVEADLKLARLRPAPCGVQHVLEVAGPAQRAFELAGERGAVRQRLEEVRSQHRLEQADVPAEMTGQARRRAHQVGDQPEQARIGAEQARTAARRPAGC